MRNASPIFAIAGCVLSCVVAVVSGCGGSDETRVVTRTVTEDAVVESAPNPQLSAADEDWARLVRQQNRELTEVARRAQSARNSYEFWQISNEVISRAGYAISTTPTAGLSPCMAGVPSQWEAVLTGFTIGGAAGTGGGTLSLRDEVLATIEECTSGSGESSAVAMDSTCTAYPDKDQPELSTREGCASIGSGLCDTETQLRAWGVTCEKARAIVDRVRQGLTAPADLDGFTCTGPPAWECRMGSRYFEGG